MSTFLLRNNQSLACLDTLLSLSPEQEVDHLEYSPQYMPHQHLIACCP